MSDPTTPPQPANKKLNVSLDLRLVILALLLIIACMLAVWRPWLAAGTDRTIKVTGESTVKAEPDEFVFYPSYPFTNTDKAAASDAATKKSEEVVAKLKALGVEDSKIKSTVDGYGGVGFGLGTGQAENYTYTAQLIVTASSRSEAQMIQDYLQTTTPQGSVTPQGSFSQSKRKELESKARDDATKDARAKADQSAKNLGFKVSKVKTVEDGTGFGEIYPMAKGGDIALDSGNASSGVPITNLAVQPGENELNYSVTVVYFVR